VTITALAGSRVITPAVPLAGEIRFRTDDPEIARQLHVSIECRHPGDPPGRFLSVLRC
jgi:hypothetical protein